MNVRFDYVFNNSVYQKSVDLGYSYSTHYYFRQKLLELTGSDKYLNKEKTEILWDDLTSDIPFYELIYFSDCEGCLDYEISEILYNQFVEYYDIAKEKLDSYYLRKYEGWLAIFESAKDNGVVVFR